MNKPNTYGHYIVIGSGAGSLIYRWRIFKADSNNVLTQTNSGEFLCDSEDEIKRHVKRMMIEHEDMA